MMAGRMPPCAHPVARHGGQKLPTDGRRALYQMMYTIIATIGSTVSQRDQPQQVKANLRLHELRPGRDDFAGLHGCGLSGEHLVGALFASAS